MWDSLPGIVAAAAVLFLLWDNRRKIRSEADNQTTQATSNITDSYDKLFIQLQARVTELEAELNAERIRLDALESENNRLRLWARLLFSQVVEAGGTPMKYDEVPHT